MSGRADKPRLSCAAQADAPFKRRMIRVVEMASGGLPLERL
jgi:hypothetical protein